MYEPAVPTEVAQSVIVSGVYFYAIDSLQVGIILTPACDIAQKKAEFLTLCGVFGAWELVKVLLKTDWIADGLVTAQGTPISLSDLSNTKRKNFTDKMRRLIRQQYQRFHWLQPIAPDSNPLVIDFQLTACLIPEEFQPSQLVASLASPYREQVPVRYAAYLGRIGTPDISNSVEQDWIDAGITAIFV